MELDWDYIESLDHFSENRYLTGRSLILCI